MFALSDNEKIGKYLQDCIEKRFESHRQFCKAYLIAMGKQADSEQIRKMSNRLSQILKGKKGIQLSDLPWFCQLLEVSCEDILSAGRSHAPTSAHLTNYAVAFSKNEQEWEDYVHREDSPVLNADEYGKTVIDYALEAENYDFLRYLMDHEFIWFVGTDEKNYFVNFGAGTSIEKNTFPYPLNFNVLGVQLRMRDELRTHMIALAIKHEDMKMLERLHAREIPCLYHMRFYTTAPDDCDKYYNENLMEALIHASDNVLAYFSKEFEITDRLGRTNRFLFPFIDELIERLLQNKNDFAEDMLNNAVQHNQYVYDQLAMLLVDEVQDYRSYYRSQHIDLKDETIKNKLIQEILQGIHFYSDGDLIGYFSLMMRKGMMSNIVRVDVDSSDDRLKRRILELNGLYDAIHHITPEFEEE